jgi:hypothetical protein
VITEYVIGYLYPGFPVANICFKVYGYISMKQGITFLEDFKLGHYMKIPPRAMFMAQVSSTYVPLPHITLAKGNCSSSCFFYSLSFLHTYMIFKFVNYTHLWSLLLFMR